MNTEIAKPTESHLTCSSCDRGLAHEKVESKPVGEFWASLLTLWLVVFLLFTMLILWVVWVIYTIHKAFATTPIDVTATPIKWVLK